MNYKNSQFTFYVILAEETVAKLGGCGMHVILRSEAPEGSP